MIRALFNILSGDGDFDNDDDDFDADTTSPETISDNQSSELKFGGSGGCDCGNNPNTCGTGHFCRWQY